MAPGITMNLWRNTWFRMAPGAVYLFPLPFEASKRTGKGLILEQERGDCTPEVLRFFPCFLFAPLEGLQVFCCPKERCHSLASLRGPHPSPQSLRDGVLRGAKGDRPPDPRQGLRVSIVRAMSDPV